MKLALGTAQFGRPYGISNTRGQLGGDEAEHVLHAARQAGINLLDTAPLYGDAEIVLGELPGQREMFVVTKTPNFRTSPLIGSAEAECLTKTFHASLARLRRNNVYGLIAHRAADLLAEGGEYLWRAMEALKAQGLVTRIGASIYSPDQVDLLMARFPIDLVQVPLNVLDQRLLSGGQLDRLKSAGIEVHARSTFLQGVLLTPPEQLPDFFRPWRAVLNEFRAAAGHSAVAAALGFVMQRQEVDRVVVGVTSAQELKEIANVASRVPSMDYARFAQGDERLLNPNFWAT